MAARRQSLTRFLSVSFSLSLSLFLFLSSLYTLWLCLSLLVFLFTIIVFRQFNLTLSLSLFLFFPLTHLAASSQIIKLARAKGRGEGVENRRQSQRCHKLSKPHLIAPANPFSARTAITMTMSNYLFKELKPKNFELEKPP